MDPTFIIEASTALQDVTMFVAQSVADFNILDRVTEYRGP